MAKYVWCPEQQKVVEKGHERPSEQVYIINDRLDRENGGYVYNPTDGLYYSSKSKLRKNMSAAGYECVGNDYNTEALDKTDFRKPLNIDYKAVYERIKHKNGW